MTVTQKAKRLATAFAAFACCALVAVALTGCQQEQRKEDVQLQVFAANSLSKAMEEAQQAYIEDGHSNVSFADTQYKAYDQITESALEPYVALRNAYLNMRRNQQLELTLSTTGQNEAAE